jgi:hypothetical protein
MSDVYSAIVYLEEDHTSWMQEFFRKNPDKCEDKTSIEGFYEWYELNGDWYRRILPEIDSILESRVEGARSKLMSKFKLLKQRPVGDEKKPEINYNLYGSPDTVLKFQFSMRGV